MSTASIESQVSTAPAVADWRRQFTRPTGRLGRLVGHLMALKNRARNDWVFAGDPQALVREFARVLRPGGRLAIAVQPRNRGAAAATADEVGRRLVALFTEAGLRDVRLERKPLRPVPVVCVVGQVK